MAGPALEGIRRHGGKGARARPAVPTTPVFQGENDEHGLPESLGEGLAGGVLFWTAVAFSIFEIVTAFGIPLGRPLLPGVALIRIIGAAIFGRAVWRAVLRSRGRHVRGGVIALLAMAAAFVLVARFGGGLPSRVVRTIHVGFLCLVAGAMPANHRAGSPAAGRAVGIVGFAVGLYHWALYHDLVNRAGDLTSLDMAIGIAVIAVLFDLVRGVMGPAPPIVAGLFLACCLFGNWLPAPLDHRGYGVDQVIAHMAFGTEGIDAVPTPVSATYILAWTRSVEKTLWEEAWRATPQGVALVEARVQGSGAGMGPPPEARLVGGLDLAAVRAAAAEVVLRRSGVTADWRICVGGACRPMGDHLPEEADPVVLTVCAGS